MLKHKFFSLVEWLGYHLPNSREYVGRSTDLWTNSIGKWGWFCLNTTIEGSPGLYNTLFTLNIDILTYTLHIQAEDQGDEEYELYGSHAEIHRAYFR
jgi:hypothetical protein